MITNSFSSSSEIASPFESALGSSRRSRRSKAFRRAVFNFLVLPLFFSPFVVQILYFWKFVPAEYGVPTKVHDYLPSFVKSRYSSTNNAAENDSCKGVLPVAYCDILLRAKNFQQLCTTNITTETSNHPNGYQGPPVDTDLPPFGIIETLERFIANQTSSQNRGAIDGTYNFTCSLPPERSCNVKKVSVITMGYKIERLQKLTGNIREIASGNKYPGLIEEIILVWNGPYELSNITETEDGLELVEMHNDPNNPVRIWYPFQHGLPNNLWNRYHPYIQPKSEAILYFDDDGPFFSPRAVMAGFELWKRHSDTQIGTLARENHLDQRQMKEKQLKITLSDKVRLGREFISTCRNQGDWIEYDYHDFPFFGAQMVLPSGSFLHRNYLCYLWHPALDIIRHFIRNHPVRPDDITVSSIITQLSGNAPRVYPSRVHSPKAHTKDPLGNPAPPDTFAFPIAISGGGGGGENKVVDNGKSTRRKLLWEDHSAKDWSAMRGHALNAVSGYFGSISSGSIGWCYGSQYHNVAKDDCQPPMPPENYIPFMNEGMFEYDRCSELPKV